VLSFISVAVVGSTTLTDTVWLTMIPADENGSLRIKFFSDDMLGLRDEC
jgi:hypothetical protein